MTKQEVLEKLTELYNLCYDSSTNYDDGWIAMAGAIATEQNRGRMQLLKWDRQEHRYFVIKVDIHGGSV